MIGAFISAMNVVREKELGTIEQINVTPIRKYQFILGKMIPLWLLGLLLFTIGLIVARLLFSVPILGSVGLLYSFAALYLVLVLGFGMFISTVTDTQQQAMFVSWFFLVVFMLMSGLFTPIENMPLWAQKLTWVNPIKYFMEVIRMVMLKGAGIQEISTQILVVTVFAFVMNFLAVWRYRKTT
jgi:ABC-2 type transport system permease protein